MKKITLSALAILITFSGLIAQKSKLTIHNKRGYKIQTGYVVDGYKEGEWMNISNRNDTSYFVYEKDKLVFSEKHIKKRYGAYKNQTLIESKYTDYRKTTVSNFLLTTHQSKVYALEKNVTCPYYSKPFYRYYISGDSKTVKTIVQQLNLTMTLYPLKNYFGTQYDNNLKRSLPQYSKIEFSIDPESGNRVISDLIIYYQGKKIEQRPDGEFFMLGGDRYELLTSVNYFFQESSAILLKKNGAVIFKQEFHKGLPVSFISYFEEGNINMSCGFKNGLPHGEFNSYYEDGSKKVECVFDEGVLYGKFNYFEQDKALKYSVEFEEGRIDGLVKGKKIALFFKDAVVLQMVEVDELGEIKKWKSGYNKFSSYKGKEDLKVDGVKYIYDKEKKRFDQFFYHSGETHFRYSDYGTRDMILINYHENKDNWFSLYIQKDGKIQDDINLTLNGKNLRKESKKQKLKLIRKRFLNVSRLPYPDILQINTEMRGDTVIRSTFLPTGKKCLEEKFVKGKLSGKRLMWGLEGNLIQEANYKENHQDGFFVSYNSKGEIVEAGNYNSGVKSGKWIKMERGTKYENFHVNSNTAKSIKAYFPSGKEKSVYIVSDSGNYRKEYKEDGSVKSEYKRNKKGKIHGPYFTTWGKGKSVKGTYLNGYKHGEFIYYDEKGKVERVVNFDYGRQLKTKQKEGNRLNSSCNCPQEFNVINGSSYYPTLDDIVSYNHFHSMFEEVFAISEKGYGKIFIRNLNNSHSSDNATRFYGMDMIVFPTSNTFMLPQYKNVQLVLTPCAKTGELAHRNVTLNTNHPLLRYRRGYDSEEDNFEMTSKNVFQLLVEMINGDFEQFITSSHSTMDELEGLTSYLRRNKFKISTSTQYNVQLKHIVDYIDKEDKEEAFFDLFFKKEFDHGILDKKVNPNGYTKFEQSIHKYFYRQLRNVTIAQLRDEIIKINARMTMEGGRYAFKHPYLLYKEKETPIFFTCKSIAIKDKVLFKGIKDICIQPNTQLKGTKMEIVKVNSIQTNSTYTRDKMVWSCLVNYKGVGNGLTVELELNKDKCKGVMNTRMLSKNEIEKIVKELKGVYTPSSQSIVFDVKGQLGRRR